MEYRQQRLTKSPQVKKKRVFVPKQEAEPASQQYAGHFAGLHPEDSPHMTTADVHSHVPATRPPQPPDDYEAGAFIANMTKRYHGVPMPDGVMIQGGNEQWYFHQPQKSDPRRPVIDRAHRTQAQLPPPKKTEEIPVQATKNRRRFHWLFFVGLALMAMLLGFVVFNAVGSWWQTHNNDTTYGRPRTFQIDAVVGHHDSPMQPSHFVAMNLNRRIVIIEIPGRDISRSVIYSGGVLVGDGQDLTPVTLSFADTNGDGKLDMLVHVLDQTIVFLNNGTKFVPPSNLATGGSNPPNQGE